MFLLKIDVLFVQKQRQVKAFGTATPVRRAAAHLQCFRLLLGEMAAINGPLSSARPSSARGITHNDIRRGPDHIYDSIFDTAVHQPTETWPERTHTRTQNPLFTLNTIYFPV